MVWPGDRSMSVAVIAVEDAPVIMVPVTIPPPALPPVGTTGGGVGSVPAGVDDGTGAGAPERAGARFGPRSSLVETSTLGNVTTVSSCARAIERAPLKAPMLPAIASVPPNLFPSGPMDA